MIEMISYRFSTDVYSFHVDRSPIPIEPPFYCTYYGEFQRNIMPNSQAKQKVLVPEIRDELKRIISWDREDFESFFTLKIL